MREFSATKTIQSPKRGLTFWNARTGRRVESEFGSESRWFDPSTDRHVKGNKDLTIPEPKIETSAELPPPDNNGWLPQPGIGH